MSSKIVIPLRVMQLVFLVLNFGLSGYVAHWYDADTLTDSPTQIRFLLFAPVFAFLSLLYVELTPRFYPRASHPYAHLTLEILNAVFYLAGFIALAVFLSKLLFCKGKVCNAAQADAAFAALSWLVWTGSAVVCGLGMFKGGVDGVKIDKRAKKAMRAEKTDIDMGRDDKVGV